MAFLLLLFPGLLLGATALALSDAERSYYYDTRNYNMRFLGSRDGCEVWQDKVTGTFYVDDGWDVSRVGTPGFVPHPVDREHLRKLCIEYSPDNLPWVDFLLATFEGRTKVLWENFFYKYQLGPKPVQPTWGKGIRKARWARYEQELEHWEQKKRELEPRFREELQMWEEQKQVYDEDHAVQRASYAGRALLQRALSGGGAVLAQPSPVVKTNNTQQYRTTVPANCPPGSTFLVNCAGTQVAVRVPQGAQEGSELQFMGPALPPIVVATPVVQQPSTAAQTPPVREVPAAIGSTQQQQQPPSPTITPSVAAPPPPPFQRNTSLKW